MKTMLMTVAAICLGGSASAQDNWTFRSTLYLWFPGIDAGVDASFGSINSEVSALDALSNLQMGFMGALAAQNGQWILWGDVVYTDIEAVVRTPAGILSTRAKVGQKLTALTSYVLYDVNASPDMTVAFGAGFRYFDLGIDASLSGGLLGDVGTSIDDGWAVPVLATQIKVPITDDWVANLNADWGKDGSDAETWQLYGGLGYRLNERWTAQVGYRHMNFVKDNAEVDLGGLLVGATFDF